MRARIEIQKRFCDLDAYGHVNNSVYMQYLEAARINLLEEMFLDDTAKGIQYVVVRVEFDYLYPVKLEDRLFVECYFEEVRGARFTIGYVLNDGSGKIFARGKTQHALFNMHSGKPLRIPETWKEFVKRDKVTSIN